MPFQMQARAIEILSVSLGKVTIRKEEKSVVLLTYRPNPAHSPESEMVAITREQAQRMRDDLGTLLDIDESEFSWD